MRTFVASVIVVASLVLGASVFREQIAWAAQTVEATIVGPVDGNGNVRVREQAVTEFLGSKQVTAGDDLTLDVRAYKSIRITMRAATCGIGAGNFVVSAAEGAQTFTIDRVDFCTATSGLDVNALVRAFRQPYETAGRTITLHVGGDGFVEVAVFGRTN